MAVMSCSICGWVGDDSKLLDAMGYDQMCPYCGSFSEKLSYHIPSWPVLIIRRLVYDIRIRFNL